MDALCGIIGKHDTTTLDAMINALHGRAKAVHRVSTPRYSVAASHPIDGDSICLLDGDPRLKSTGVLSPASVHCHCSSLGNYSHLALLGPYTCVVALDEGRRWLLMRDALGRRPMFYFQGGNFLAFASELKALLASGIVPKRLNLLAVDRYLTLRFVPGPESIVAGIYRVEPGHVVEYCDGHVSSARSTSFDIQSREQPREIAARELRLHLSNAMDREKPDNILWSGGIDCAALAACAPGIRPTFVSLERGWQDEARLAAESARLMKMPLAPIHARRLTEDTVHRTVRALDEPLADPSVLALWLVAEAAAENGQHFVSGHGADELLGGYPRYNFLQKAHGAKRLVPAGLLADILPALPPNAFIRRGGRYLTSMNDPLESYLSLVSVFDRGEREDLYSGAMNSAVHDLGGGIPAVQDHFTKGDMTRNVLALDLNVGIPNLLMTKCDRIAAAHGIDIRFPYLDDEVVAFAVALAPSTKFGVRSKPLLRRAMRGMLPAPVRLRARRDFRFPQSGRAQRVIENVASQVVTPEYVDATGLFRWNAVDTILREANHNIYRRRQFWALVMFFAWYHNVMEA
ncbi:MAG: asparagine synthase-related protein [Candidatus Hydrogenedentes bacterium]|nr:asparagine synthase-related protein [Candidatus Hydrogenedentota bacterium]